MSNLFQQMTIAAMFLGAIPMSGARADQFSLTGAWSLQSMTFVDETTGKSTANFGEHPKGYMIYSPNGYMIGLINAEGRQPVPANSDGAEMRALFSTMNAIAGPYDFSDGKLIIHVEVAHDPRMVGTDSVRSIRVIDDNHVEATTPVSGTAAGNRAKVVLIWQRTA